jgi:hypothetical protein
MSQVDGIKPEVRQPIELRGKVINAISQIELRMTSFRLASFIATCPPKMSPNVRLECELHKEREAG